MMNIHPDVCVYHTDDHCYYCYDSHQRRWIKMIHVSDTTIPKVVSLAVVNKMADLLADSRSTGMAVYLTADEVEQLNKVINAAEAVG